MGVPCPSRRAGRGRSQGTLEGREKGLLFALELSRHWSPCPGAAGRLLARWRAAGERRESWAEQPASPPAAPPITSPQILERKTGAMLRPGEVQPPLLPR